MNPRSIATQGLGRSTRLVAVQGLWPDAGSSATGGGFRPRRFRMPHGPAHRTAADSDALLLAVTLAAGLGVLQ